MWAKPEGPPAGGDLGRAVEEVTRLFHEAMDDDFNTAKALGHLFDFARDVNRALDEGLGEEARAGARALFKLGGVLGLFWKAPAGESWDAEIMALVDQREAARKARDWKRADAIRADLGSRGVLVEDGPEGPKLKRS